MKKKIVFILLILLFVSVISIVGIKVLNTKEVNKSEIPITQEKKENSTQTKDNKDVINNESNQEEPKNNEKQNSSKNTQNIDKHKNIDSNDKTTTTSTSSNNNSTNKKNNTTKTQKQDSTVKEENPQEKQNQSPHTSYVGVPDPNNFNYSFHHGKIEYATESSCLEAVPEISFKDTTDITNCFCMEVVDSENTVLGYYLYIKCKSGNCDRYKN